MQTQFKPGDMVEVEFRIGEPIVPGAADVPFRTKGRIVKLADVALVRKGEPITAEPGAVVDLNLGLDGIPLKKRLWRDEAVPLKHIRSAA